MVAFKMKLVLLLTFIPLLVASRICKACFDHLCYNIRKIFEAEQIIGQIAIDRLNNHLHLHYTDSRNSDHTTIVDLNFDDLKSQDLPVKYSFARAVNQDTGEVYFSGNTGIYKYSAVTKATTRYGEFSKKIWHMHYKDKLYFIEFNREGLYYIENNRTKCVSSLSNYIIDEFIIDKHDDIYFTSSYLIYRLKHGTDEPQLFSTIVYSLTTDLHGNALFFHSYDKTVFTLYYSRYKLYKWGRFSQDSEVTGLVYDKLNRPIYVDANDGKVYLLTQRQDSCIYRYTTTPDHVNHSREYA